jgi:hypothetical protein
MDAYDYKVLAAIRQIDEADPEPHPALHLERVAKDLDPVERDLERLDVSIAKLTQEGYLEADLPPLQQTVGPTTFRLSW